jgi:hypothetical protein
VRELHAGGELPGGHGPVCMCGVLARVRGWAVSGERLHADVGPCVQGMRCAELPERSGQDGVQGLRGG